MRSDKINKGGFFTLKNVVIWIVIACVILGAVVFTKYGMAEVVTGAVVGVQGVAKVVEDTTDVVGEALGSNEK